MRDLVTGPPQPDRPRRLDRKLATIAAGGYTPDDFVIADAKDADMAFGVTAPGPLADGGAKTRDGYLGDMRAQVALGTIDILLTSAANAERLSADGSLGAGSDEDGVTLAVRANDTTDIWNPRGAGYNVQPARPFRTADLAAVRPFCDLVLYSVTFNNDPDRDLAMLNAYREFRVEAAAAGIRHFLEVFNPNAPVDLKPDDVGGFVNDSIIRALAGVTSVHRPTFLKIAYNGAEAMAELTGHDSSLVVGVLGGSSGTTRDTFELLQRSEASGARVALFGRKIQRSESQLDLVALMPEVLRGDLSPADGVRAYHERIAAAGVAPHRSLDDDLQVTDPLLLAE